MNELDRKLSSALDGHDFEVILEWLVLVTGHGDTIPETDSTGRVDQCMNMFKQGQRSVVDKLLLAKRVLKENESAN